MDEQVAELIPLFLAESRGRLGRLMRLAPRVREPATVTEVRRELHTLRGSCRLLELSQMAEICRAGEELLEDPPPDLEVRLGEFLERFGLLLREAAEQWEDDGEGLEAG